MMSQAEAARRAVEGNVEAVMGAAAGDDDDDDLDQDEEFFGQQFQMPYSDAHPFVYFYETFAGTLGFPRDGCVGVARTVVSICVYHRCRFSCRAECHACSTHHVCAGRTGC